MDESAETQTEGLDFIRRIIESDLATKRISRVVSRFPPEPNGFLHIGHVMASGLNFAVAREYGGICHLRFDDTNPSTEDESFVEAQIEDLRWLGYDWGEHQYFASDYFERFHEFAVQLITAGKAFVDDQTAEEIRAHQGSLTQPGVESRYRNRSVDENLELFASMKAGKFEEGSRVLRAKIDMASPVVAMRDPIMYRIQHTPHYRTGDRWCIYPMYDYAHPLSDAIEGVTHSLCSIEFVDHRPVYDWFIAQLDFRSRPQQIEFSRVNVQTTLTSKRRLAELIRRGHVRGWDDPRMPTVRGMRRRGYSASALHEFCRGLGVTKRNKLIPYANLEFHVRQELNRTARRVMAVLHPLRVVIENYPEGQTEELTAINNPEDVAAGTRPLVFGRELYIERDDFVEDPPKGFRRLAPGREVRLRYAYFLTCREVIKDDRGTVVELRCTYDPATRGGDAPDGRKPAATIHWLSAAHALPAEVRVYDRLFSSDEPGSISELESFLAQVNPRSEELLAQVLVEPSLANAAASETVQFERHGYFSVDPDSRSGALVFNRTVALRDSWEKEKRRQTP